ncbi:MAG: flavin-containing monooxygenase [Thermoanaerobaculia bacterium]
MYSHKIALVGAGFAGLGMAAALRRHGIAYDQFDSNDRVGGLWHRGVYAGVHTITSKGRTRFADFPMPAHYPEFPSREQVAAYLESFAEHHRLGENLFLDTRVKWIEPAEESRWRITFESGEERVYRGVIIASGQQWDCRYPEHEGKFAGEVLHSGQYRDPDVLRGKRVLVVGGGNSAADIAVDAARHAAAAHISIRRGHWYVPKTLLGIPFTELLKDWLPLSVQRFLIRLLVRISVGSYESYGLERPQGRLFDDDPTINDQLLYWIRHGRITPQKGIARIDQRTVEFVDGRSEEIDLICYATGFHASIPFLQPGIVRFVDGVPDLVAGLFAENHRNLYVFGIGKLLPIPRYGVGPPITFGADLLALCIREQEKLTHSLAEVLIRLGGRPDAARRIDPRSALWLVRAACRLVPRLHRIESWLFPAVDRRFPTVEREIL